MNSLNSNVGLSPELRTILAEIGNSGLPVIRGKWFIVDPYKLTVADGGIPGSFASIEDAYAACTSGYGDGILVLAGGTGTASQTSSYLKQPLAWSKHGITVVGVGAPTRMAQRARISNTEVATTSSVISQAASSIDRETGSFVTDGWVVGMTGTTVDSGSNNGSTFTVTAVSALSLTISETFNVQAKASVGACVMTSYITHMIDVSGSNNSFFNLHIAHFGTQVLGLTALKVTGSRNYFQNIHAGIGIASAASVATRSLWLSAAEENTFVDCVFGLDTVDRGANATYDILLSGAVARNRFYGCETVKQSTSGTGCLAVYANATTGGRPTLFKNCVFTSWNTAGGNANMAYMFGSTGACDFVWFVDCTYPGYAALSNDAVAWISGEINSQASGLMYT